MDLDASRKAQLIVFITTLLGTKEKKFPVGYVAHMVYKGVSGTYIYNGYHQWQRVG